MKSTAFILAKLRICAGLLTATICLSAVESYGARIINTTFSSELFGRVSLNCGPSCGTTFDEYHFNPSFQGVDPVDKKYTWFAWHHGDHKYAPPFQEPSHHIFGNGGSGVLNLQHGEVNVTSGQIGAATGIVQGSVEALYEEQSAGAIGVVVTAWARAMITLTFDETVRFRVAYASQHGSSVAVFANGVQLVRETFGTLEFDTNRVTMDLFAGDSGSAWADGNPNSPNIPSFDSFTHFGPGTGAIWSFSALNEVPVLPGTVPAIPVVIHHTYHVDPSGGFDPVPIGKLPINALPNALTYVGTPKLIEVGVLAGALVQSYSFSSTDNPITSFIVPELLAGADLAIAFGNETRQVIAGETIDFGALGIDEFEITGFNPATASSAREMFVFGLQFAEEGLASLVATPMLYIPPGDFNQNGLVDTPDYIIARKNASTEQYDLWRSHFGDPSSPGTLTASTIPEPTTLLLLGVAAISLLGYRKAKS